MRRGHVFALVAACTAALFGGCGIEGNACYPTDWEACTCAEGARGYHQCSPSGDDHGACDCSGATPGAESMDAGPVEGGTLGAFLASCTVNAECASNVCFTFNSKGPHCTIPCNADMECPAPSPGCSHMGVCKAQ